MSRNGYSTRNFGWHDQSSIGGLGDMVLNTDTVITFQNGTTEITNTSVTTTNISSETIVTKNLDVENLNLGRYALLNSKNSYNESQMDSGIVMNLETSPDLSFTVDGDFSGQTVHVTASTGLLPSQLIQVQSELNTGLYEVLTHIGGVITINPNPTEPMCYGEFRAESATGSLRAVNVGVLRYSRAGTLSQSEPEIGSGDFAGIEYNELLYNTKDSGVLGSISLTDDTNQLILNEHTTISAPGTTNRLHTIADTASDNFVFRNDNASLTNKTMTNNNNNVIARGLWVGSGSDSVSTYAGSAPSTGQILQASSSSSAGWVTPFTVEAGDGLQQTATAGGADNQSSTISWKRDQDNPDDSDPDEPTFPQPGTSGTNFEMPLSVPVTVPIVASAAGAVAAFAVVAGALAVGELGASFEGPVIMNGDLTVNGTMTTVSAENISTASRYLYLNSGYSAATPLSTGMVSNRLPIGSEMDVSNFNAGDGSNNPTCDCTTASGLVTGDILHIYGDGAYSGPNAGYYEVVSHTGSVITVRGTLTPRLKGWTQPFSTEVETLKAVHVTVTGFEMEFDGRGVFFNGSNTGTMVTRAVAYDTSSPLFTGVTADTLVTDSISEKTAAAGVTINQDCHMAFGKGIYTSWLRSVAEGLPIASFNSIAITEDDPTHYLGAPVIKCYSIEPYTGTDPIQISNIATTGITANSLAVDTISEGVAEDGVQVMDLLLAKNGLWTDTLNSINTTDPIIVETHLQLSTGKHVRAGLLQLDTLEGRSGDLVTVDDPLSVAGGLRTNSISKRDGTEITINDQTIMASGKTFKSGSILVNNLDDYGDGKVSVNAPLWAPSINVGLIQFDGIIAIDSDRLDVTNEVQVPALTVDEINARTVAINIVDPLVAQSTALFQDAVTCQTDLFAPNLVKTSLQDFQELVYDPTNGQVLTRHVSIANARDWDERFENSSSTWVPVPIQPIGDFVIDSIVQAIGSAIVANTQGVVQGDYNWRVLANNTDNIYCGSPAYGGLYCYIPEATNTRNYCISKTMQLTRGSGDGGFRIQYDVAFQSLDASSKWFVGLSTNAFSLNGNDTLVNSTNSIGFLIDHSLNSNYKFIVVRSDPGGVDSQQSTVTATTGATFRLVLEWNASLTTLTYSINGTTIPVTNFSSNPLTYLRWDPIMTLYRPSGTNFNCFLKRVKAVHYA